MTKKVLGFTGKFYAVWTITISEKEIHPGCIRVFTQYTYGRKVSKYLNVALSKYPNIQVEDILNDKTKSFWTKDYIWNSINIFRFGKYTGQVIDECPDTDYIAWYWKNIYDDHKKYVEGVLISRGWNINIKEVVDDDNIFTVKVKEVLSSDETAIKNEDVDNMSEDLRKVYTAKEIEFTPTRNITCNGNYLENNKLYHFIDYKHVPATYYSPDYYLPTVNGKGVRIKNKKVVVTDFKVEMNNNKIIVNIIKFKVTK